MLQNKQAARVTGRKPAAVAFTTPLAPKFDRSNAAGIPGFSSAAGTGSGSKGFEAAYNVKAVSAARAPMAFNRNCVALFQRLFTAPIVRDLYMLPRPWLIVACRLQRQR